MRTNSIYSVIIEYLKKKGEYSKRNMPQSLKDVWQVLKAIQKTMVNPILVPSGMCGPELEGLYKLFLQDWLLFHNGLKEVKGDEEKESILKKNPFPSFVAWVLPASCLG
jgi:hypothetical protein